TQHMDSDLPSYLLCTLDLSKIWCTLVLKVKIMCRQNHVHMEREKSMDNREYNQLESLTSSSNTEISRLSLIVKNLKERLESLERNQTDLMSKLNDFQKEMDAEDDGDNTD